MKEFEITRIKEVGKKTIADFIRSETGSVGIKNAATIGAFAGALMLSQTISEAVTGTCTFYDANGNVVAVAI